MPTFSHLCWDFCLAWVCLAWVLQQSLYAHIEFIYAQALLYMEKCHCLKIVKNPQALWLFLPLSHINLSHGIPLTTREFKSLYKMDTSWQTFSKSTLYSVAMSVVWIEWPSMTPQDNTLHKLTWGILNHKTHPNKFKIMYHIISALITGNQQKVTWGKKSQIFKH